MDRVVLCLAIVVVVVLTVSAAAQWNWIPRGRVRTAVVFLAGVVVILTLRTGGVPPAWFAGGKVGFGLAASFLVSGALTRRGEARDFGLPLFLGLGLTLLALNVVQFAENVL